MNKVGGLSPHNPIDNDTQSQNVDNTNSSAQVSGISLSENDDDVMVSLKTEPHRKPKSPNQATFEMDGKEFKPADFVEDKALTKPAHIRDKPGWGEKLVKTLAVVGVVAGGVVLGAVAGAAIGTLAGGVGSIPGAIAGAIAGGAKAAAIVGGGAAVVGLTTGMGMGKLMSKIYGGRAQGIHLENAVKTLNRIGVKFSNIQQHNLDSLPDDEMRRLLSVPSKRGKIGQEQRQAIRTAVTSFYAKTGDFDKAQEYKHTMIALAAAGDSEHAFKGLLLRQHPALALIADQDNPIDWPAARDRIESNGTHSTTNIKLVKYLADKAHISENLDFMAALAELKENPLETENDQKKFKRDLAKIRDEFIDNSNPDNSQINISYSERTQLLEDLSDENLSHMSLDTMKAYQNFRDENSGLKTLSQAYDHINILTQDALKRQSDIEVRAEQTEAAPTEPNVPHNHAARAGAPWYNEMVEKLGIPDDVLDLQMPTKEGAPQSVRAYIGSMVDSHLDTAVKNSDLNLKNKTAVQKEVMKGLSGAMYQVKNRLDMVAIQPRIFNLSEQQAEKLKLVRDKADELEERAAELAK